MKEFENYYSNVSASIDDGQFVVLVIDSFFFFNLCPSYVPVVLHVSIVRSVRSTSSMLISLFLFLYLPSSFIYLSIYRFNPPPPPSLPTPPSQLRRLL
jgi:hypothetical protein